jgi:hypothetical protein
MVGIVSYLKRWKFSEQLIESRAFQESVGLRPVSVTAPALPKGTYFWRLKAPTVGGPTTVHPVHRR